MKLDQNASAKALATVSTLLFLVCAIFVLILPKETTQVFSWWIHTDLASLGIVRQVTPANFIGGLAFSVISGLAVGWIFAKIYNMFVKE